MEFFGGLVEFLLLVVGSRLKEVGNARRFYGSRVV